MSKGGLNYTSIRFGRAGELMLALGLGAGSSILYLFKAVAKCENVPLAGLQE